MKEAALCFFAFSPTSHEHGHTSRHRKEVWICKAAPPTFLPLRLGYQPWPMESTRKPTLHREHRDRGAGAHWPIATTPATTCPDQVGAASDQPGPASHGGNPVAAASIRSWSLITQLLSPSPSSQAPRRHKLPLGLLRRLEPDELYHTRFYNVRDIDLLLDR